MKKTLACLLSALLLGSMTIGAAAATAEIQTIKATLTNSDNGDNITTLEGTITSKDGSNVTVTHCDVLRFGQEWYHTTEIIDYANDTITLIGPAYDSDTAIDNMTRSDPKTNFGMPSDMITGIVDEGGYRGWMSAAQLDLGKEIADSNEVTVEFIAKVSAPNIAFGWEKGLCDSYGFGLSDQNGGFGLFCGWEGINQNGEVSFHQYIPHGVNGNPNYRDINDFPSDMIQKYLAFDFANGAAVKMVRNGDKVKVYVNDSYIAEYDCAGKTVLTFGVCSQKLEVSDIKVNGKAFDIIENTSDTSGTVENTPDTTDAIENTPDTTDAIEDAPDTSDNLGISAVIVAAAVCGVAVICGVAFIAYKKKKI